MGEIIGCGRALDVFGREDRQRAVGKGKGEDTRGIDRAQIGSR